MNSFLEVTLTKDHWQARSFRVSLPRLYRWIFAWLLTLLLLAGLSVGLFFLWAQSKTQTMDPETSQKLKQAEQQAATLETENLELRNSLKKGAPVNALPEFSLLPLEAYVAGVPSRDQLPFKVIAPNVAIKNSELVFSTALEYTKNDGGSQQGHFLILAVGNSLTTYPAKNIGLKEGKPLLDPESGEYFSVGRYREINAKFTGVSTKAQVQTFAIYIFNKVSKLIYYQTYDAAALGEAKP